ncbi:ribonuclease P protein component [Dysgonomonas sp. 25]|uniref:ribonuclease P protein component n=1 Tax=Dysgonomonas sp. 25 TaxID=2302933 RepID=UPI0013D4509F|nr:ribonuclease P protein component [Dysgonomonas sp. 25]NDV67331.1 ribonuclease P protein component [Dysgonomonas sp. 25]
MTSEKTIIQHTFPKNEKLCGEKRIERLFREGESFIAYPLRVVFCIDKSQEEDLQKVSVLVSVPKRKFKRAVKRNLLKRRIREAYRLNKHRLTIGKQVDVAFTYVSDELFAYAEIEKAMQKALHLLTEKLSNR